VHHFEITENQIQRKILKSSERENNSDCVGIFLLGEGLAFLLF
jgi:hypothetical protein